MVDIGMIASAVQGLQAASQIAQSMAALRDEAAVQSKVIELQQAILAVQSTALAAQSEHLALIQRIRDLEEQLEKSNKWQQIKERYELRDYGSGSYAYGLKEIYRKEEPDHRVCARCFEDQKRSILQFRFRTSSGQDKFDCKLCSTQYYFGSRQQNSGSGSGMRGSDYGW